MKVFDSAGREKRGITPPFIVDVFANRPSASGLPNGVRFIASDFQQEWVVYAGAWVTVPSSSSDGMQAGVLASGHGVVTWNSVTQVTVAAGAAWVAQASGLLQRIAWASTVISGIPAAAAQNRIDQIVVDSNGAVTRLAGTEQAGATLDNAAGTTSRAAVPAGSLRLWEFQVTTAGVQATVGTLFRDRRPRATGAHVYVRRTANIGLLNAGAMLDQATFRRRIEVGAATNVVRILLGSYQSVTNGTVTFILYRNGIQEPNEAQRGETQNGTNYAAGLTAVWDIQPGAGSHLLDLYGQTSGSSATIQGPMTWRIIEDVHAPYDNGSI